MSPVGRQDATLSNLVAACWYPATSLLNVLSQVAGPDKSLHVRLLREGGGMYQKKSSEIFFGVEIHGYAGDALLTRFDGATKSLSPPRG